jgi:hypothetical protein
MSAAVGHAGPLHSFVVSFDASGAVPFFLVCRFFWLPHLLSPFHHRRLPTPHSLNNSM